MSGLFDTDATIAAIATARGAGGVAIVRVSGRQAWPIVTGLFSPQRADWQPGRVYHGWVMDGEQPVDEVLLLLFQEPHSYTGEDVAEIHCHGGEALSERILNLCLERGARLARPGEYTLRAFLNGKMDLTQAESVMDLVSARSERMMEQATGNLKNRSLGQAIDRIREPLVSLQARIVASVDFPDEVEEPPREELLAHLLPVCEQVERLRQSAYRNRLVRDGLKVAILGMPNSGKSSIFNALLATDRSIVTDIAGTTRDVVTETLHIKGLAVTLVDTAGIRETRHSIEMMGIERSWQAANEAQIILYVIDASVGLLRYDTQILGKLDPANTLIIGNKLDAMPSHFKRYPQWLYVSARTGEGIADLYAQIEQMIGQISHEETGLSLALNQRQVACCEAVAESLEAAVSALNDHRYPLDLVTVPLTEALSKLDELMGRDTTEEVLTSVFERFCVGK